MKSSAPIAAIAALAIFGYSTATLAADDKDRPSREPSPQRNTEERPFGGPPPGNREIRFKKAGKKCATAASVCDLSKARAVGTFCTCPEGCAAAPVSDPATPRAAPSLSSRSTTLRLV
jgi:hypothetical protein